MDIPRKDDNGERRYGQNSYAVRRRNWLIACAGKVAFESHGVANKTRLLVKGGRNLKVYKCNSCGKYHFATDKPREKRNADYL